MESFVHLRKGTTPTRVHADLGRPPGTTSWTRRFHRSHRQYVSTSRSDRVSRLGPLRPTDVPPVSSNPAMPPTPRAPRCCCSPTPTAASFLSRRGGHAVSRPLRRRRPAVLRASGQRTPGDRIRAAGVPHRATGSTCQGVHLAATARSGEHLADGRGDRRVRGPAGPLGRHWLFDPSQATIPENRPGRGRRARRIRGAAIPPADGRGVQTTTLLYAHNPIDVEGWRGDNFAFTFNHRGLQRRDLRQRPPAADRSPVHAGDRGVRLQLPALPAETVPGTERTPWYHRNVDFDEIAFFHGGSLYGIPMPPGLISHAPQGVHHGARRRAANARGASSTNAITRSTGR